MKQLKNEELQKIEGGGIGFTTGLIITAGVAFLIGVIDGFVRPLPCR